MLDTKRLHAYLERIGCGDIRLGQEGCKATERTPQTLEKLIRGHLERVPFENLDVFDFGKIPALEEEVLFEKIVGKRRGGYCFELNTLFRRLLEALGFSCYPVAARVLWNKESLPPASHMGIVAPLGGKSYYCDVGYGGPGPKGLLCLSKEAQSVAGEAFRVSRTADGDTRIERQSDGGWKPLLQFRDTPVREVDFQVMNFYCARHPDILFTQKRIVHICTPQGSKALTDMELVVRENGNVRRSVYRNDEELAAGLRDEFGILAEM